MSNVGCQNTCCTAVLGCCTLVWTCKRIFKSIERCSLSIWVRKSYFTSPRQRLVTQLRLIQNTLPSSMFGNMFFESPLASPNRPPQGNTCVSMAKMRILGRKSHQNDGFEPNFCHFSKTSRSGSGGCSTLFFNVF